MNLYRDPKTRRQASVFHFKIYYRRPQPMPAHGPSCRCSRTWGVEVHFGEDSLPTSTSPTGSDPALDPCNFGLLQRTGEDHRVVDDGCGAKTRSTRRLRSASGPATWRATVSMSLVHRRGAQLRARWSSCAPTASYHAAGRASPFSPRRTWRRPSPRSSGAGASYHREPLQDTRFDPDARNRDGQSKYAKRSATGYSRTSLEEVENQFGSTTASSGSFVNVIESTLRTNFYPARGKRASRRPTFRSRSTRAG